MGAIFLVTGSDTGVGKTVVAQLLTRRYREAGDSVVALKPVCSGGRQDARSLRTAAGNVLPLDAVNPWHFRAPIAPLLAARQMGVRLRRDEVVAHIRRISRPFAVTVVEGAGGLLSPLGEDFNTRDLLVALRARPVVVCPNRLGAINQTLLVLAALPRRAAATAQVVLVASPKPDRSARDNPALLAQFVGSARVHSVPWLGTPCDPLGPSAATRAALDSLRM